MNWQEHIKQFNEISANSGISIKEYADHYGLNYNTARRYLKKVDDQSGGDQPSKTIIDQASPATTPKKKAAAKPASRKKKPAAARGGTMGQAGSRAAAAKSKKKAPADSNVINLPHSRAKPGKPHQMDNDWKAGAKVVMDIIAPPEDEPKYRRVRTGINQKLQFHDLRQAVEVIKQTDFLDTLEADLMVTAIARRDMLANVNAVVLEQLEIKIGVYNGHIQPDDDRYIELKDNEDPYAALQKHQIENSYAMSDALRVISQLEQSAHKKKEDHERHAKAVTYIDQVYEMMEVDGISPLDAVRWLERRGVKAPVSLMAEAQKEIKAEVPPDTDVTSTVDPATLDAEARKYREMKEGKQAFLEERRATVAGIVDRGGYGDLDENGQRRDGEGLDEYDDEEFDPEVIARQSEEDEPDEDGIWKGLE